MCARFTLTADDKTILQEYNLKYVDPFSPNYNVAITQETPVITADEPEVAQNMHFGIVPHFASEPKLQGDTWNSRNDKLLESNLWRPLIKNVKTCLVLTTGFLEFKEISKKPGDKDPYMLKVLGRDIYAMAGLYSVWKSKDGKEVYKSYSIITTDANPLMADIHWTKKRQPFILRKEQEKLWLDKGISVEDRMSLIDIFPDDEMVAVPLSRSINKVSTAKTPNNFAHLLEPVNSL